MALAGEILTKYAALTTGPRIAFFEALATGFGPDRAALDAAVAAWQAEPSDATAAAVHRAAEPRRQELLRRLNLAPGGTAALVRMREQLLDALDHRDDLAAVDADFVHLFSSWFNRGFLVLRRIDWSTPAMILEKIIRYEAVHEIRELGRPAPPHRSARPPLLCVLPSGAARRAADLRRGRADPRNAGRDCVRSCPVQREALTPDKATTATFYSISNCQRGLAGVSFGNFLIKQVVEEISRENARLQTFVTLSPVPDFARWLDARAQDRKLQGAGAPRTARRSAGLDRPGWWQSPEASEPLREPLLRARRLVFPARAQPPRPAVRRGGALPSRQRRAARAHRLARRRHGERHRASPTA